MINKGRERTTAWQCEQNGKINHLKDTRQIIEQNVKIKFNDKIQSPQKLTHSYEKTESILTE